MLKKVKLASVLSELIPSIEVQRICDSSGRIFSECEAINPTVIERILTECEAFNHTVIEMCPE